MNYILIIIIIIIIILILLKKKKIIEKLTNTEYKYVCLYAYYEKNEKYKNNFKYFINNGILDNVLYYIIINGFKCSVVIPKKQNIIVVYKDNVGYDFGAWAYCLEKYVKQKYDYYIFINTSVIGPIINKNMNWLNEFLLLFNSKDVKLVGTSINMLDNYPLKQYYFNNFYKTENKLLTHVQSMFFILDYEGFKHLQNHNFFNYDKISKYSFIDLIFNYEVKCHK